MSVLNRVLSVLLALALLGVGLAAIAWSVVRALGGEAPAIDDALAAAAGLRPSSRGLQAACALAALVGLLLLGAELAPRAPPRLHLQGTWWAERAAAERGLAMSVDQRTPAVRTRVRLRERAGAWRVRVDAAGPSDLMPEVDQEVREQLRRLGRAAGATIDVRMRRGGRAA